MGPVPDNSAVLILGGAGFIGSHIAARFVDEGYRVTVIDGLLDRTGGRLSNLEGIQSQIEFIQMDVRAVPDLDRHLDANDVVIDSMAWTAHRDALNDPSYDLSLNVECHLHLMPLLNDKACKVIYLGSRGQYGNPPVEKIREDTPAIPLDIQGIHKVATESYYRIFSAHFGFPTVNLLLPNCYGENQPVSGTDVGLVGMFLRELIQGKTVNVFGGDRLRYLAYAGDVAAVVFRLSRKEYTGFNRINLAGFRISIEELVKTMIEVIGCGDYVLEDIPEEIRLMDMGNALIDQQKCQEWLGEVPLSELKPTLENTAAYFRETMDDSAL